MTTYFVAQNAAGAADGSTVNDPVAIATFNAAGAPFNDLDGDTVYLLDAITTAVAVPDGGANEAGRVTIRGDYAGHACTIANTATAKSVTINGKSYVTFQGFTIAPAHAVATAHGLAIDGATTGVTVASVTIDMTAATDATTYGLSSSGTPTSPTLSNVTISGAKREQIYFLGAAATSVAFSSVACTGGRGIYILNANGLTLTTVSSNTTAAGYSGIRISACSGILNVNGYTSTTAAVAGMLIENSTFSGSATSTIANAAITSSGSNGFNVSASSGFTFKGCTTDSVVTNYGFLIQGASTDIKHVRCTATDTAGTGAAFRIANAAADGNSHDFEYTACTADSNDGDGFMVANDVHNVTYTQCLATGNGDKTTTTNGDGFTAHDTNYNIYYYHCVSLLNTASGFGLVGASSGRVWNCTAVNNAGDWSAEGGGKLDQIRGGFYFAITGLNVVTGLGWDVKNCIGKGNYPREILLAAVDVAGAWTDFNYNLYNPTNAAQFASLDSGATNITYADWIAHANGYDANSPANADPIFVSATDFHLKPSSPAIDSGTDVSLTSDFDGHTVPHGDYPDIGAYEFIATEGMRTPSLASPTIGNTKRIHTPTLRSPMLEGL